MSLTNAVYHTFLKRTSTFAVTFVAAGLVLEQAFEMSVDNLYDRMNKGKLWKDIAPKNE